MTETNNLIFLIILPGLIYLANFLCKKNFFLINYSGEIHQKFTSQTNVPLTGGIFIFISFILFYVILLNEYIIFVALFFATGLISDLKIIKSPSKKFFIQAVIILTCVIVNNLLLENTRILILDNFLNNNLFNIIFVSFCILIIVNGSNFIDGVNTLVIGYYVLISFFILSLKLNNSIMIQDVIFNQWIFFLLILFIFNLFGKMFLGDNGSYLLGFIFSFLLILIYSSNQNISPFFIIQLLWYPALENIFSITRKFVIKRSPFIPDQNHLHQLLFFYLKNRFKWKVVILNSLTAQIINFFNFIVFFVASQDIYHTQYQIIILIISIITYLVTYLKLFSFKFKGRVVQW
jgi:UDP-N-acetylmuramyl pentapeptide phosphotransferase/UDP-N-acetylglucosamine-1-phosphate transferase